MATEQEFGIFEEEIPAEIFSFRESMRTRWKELRHSFSLLKRSPLFVFGFITIVFLVIVAVAAPFITPYGPREFALDNIENKKYDLEPPGAADQRKYILWSDVSSLPVDISAGGTEIAARSSIVDLNNDSKFDILVGTNDKRLLLFQNVGVIEDGVVQNEWVINESYQLPTIPENVTRVSPTSGDIDRDNDTDIVFGGDNGWVYSSLNIGSPTSPNWTIPAPMRDRYGQQLIFQGQAHPTLVNYDRDSDNRTDLVVGAEDYTLYVYRNKASVDYGETWKIELHEGNPKDFLGNPLKFDRTHGNGSVRVNFVFINQDEKWDMILIFDSGHFHYLTSFGMKTSPSFIFLDKDEASVTFEFPLIDEVAFMDFHWFDLTNDNRSDLFLIYNNGSVNYGYQYLEQDPRTHYFGTDSIGGDIFSRCLWALQLDLLLAIWVVFAAIIIGTIIGATAGYFGGWVDQLTMRVTDIFFAFPGLILAMAIAAALGQSMFNLSIALIAVWWAGYARIARGQVLSEKNRLYVEAAKAVGLSNTRIIFRHVLPNSIYPLLVAATLDLGGVVLTAAGLSFIGFGANPGDAELGRMIADGRNYFIAAPWVVFFPGIVIFLIVLAFNLIGDGIRDVMDPKIRR